ncbi:MAG: OmpA family protein [Candidatus Nitrospinota bacterium M3_3B_026]
MASKDSPGEKQLSVPCPGCSARARIPLSKIPASGVIYTCPACKIAIRLAREGGKISVRRAKEAEVEKHEDGGAAPPREKPLEEIVKGAPAWVVTFADLATLLLTFFVLMLSFANMDIIRFKELVGSVQDRYGVTKLERGSYQAVSLGDMAEVDSNIKEAAAAAAREKLVNVVYDAVSRQGFRGAASITSTDEGVRVRVRGRVLFEPGDAKLAPGGEKLLEGLVQIVKSMKDLELVVEGHTDNRPVASAKYPSNWELSVTRASNALEWLISKGAPPERLSAAGYADTRPLFPNDRDETRILNRRIEFLFRRL